MIFTLWCKVEGIIQKFGIILQIHQIRNLEKAEKARITRVLNHTRAKIPVSWLIAGRIVVGFRHSNFEVVSDSNAGRVSFYCHWQPKTIHHHA